MVLQEPAALALEECSLPEVHNQLKQLEAKAKARLEEQVQHCCTAYCFGRFTADEMHELSRDL